MAVLGARVGIVETFMLRYIIFIDFGGMYQTNFVVAIARNIYVVSIYIEALLLSLY